MTSSDAASTEVRVITAQGPSSARFLSPAAMLRGLSGNRFLIRQLAWRDVLVRYRGSYLGLIWSIVNPLMVLVVYTFVFGVFLGIRFGHESSGGRLDFALNFFSGLIVYNVFSACVGRASSLIVGNPNYVKKVVFPLEILPVSILGSALVDCGIGLGVLVALLALFWTGIPWTVFLFPLVLIPVCALSLGAAWLLASMGVFLRDIGHAVGVLLQLLFFLSPVVYPVSGVPEAFQPILRLNPLTTVLEGARRTLMLGLPPEWAWLLAVTVFSLLFMQLGYLWFMRTKRLFADFV